MTANTDLLRDLLELSDCLSTDLLRHLTELSDCLAATLMSYERSNEVK